MSGQLMLSGLALRFDLEDRIALLGKNGNGKSTFIRLISQRLEPREGKAEDDAEAGVGYFSQHQEETGHEATPFDHMSRRARARRRRAKVRAQLGGFGFSRDAPTSRSANCRAASGRG